MSLPHVGVGCSGHSAAVAKGALAWQHYIPLMRASRAGAVAVAVDFGTEEVGAWIGAGRVDVIVLGEVAHGCCWERSEIWCWNCVRMVTGKRIQKSEGRCRERGKL